MMIKELKLTRRRKLLGAVVICVALITGSTILWQMGQVAEAAILDPHPGLVGWWRFDEEVGNVAEDSSGYGNHGTVYGATWVDGKYGKALSFDGTNDYVEIPSSDVLVPGEITIGFWVKVVNPFASTYEGFVCRNSRTNGFQVIKAWSSGKILVEGWVDSTQYYMISGHVLQADTWTHVVVTAVADGIWTLYVNGQLDKESTGNVLPQAVMPLLIGRAAQGTSNPYLNGVIDEVRVYNRVLSSTEIETLSEKEPDFSSRLLAKLPKGATQFISTLSWQGDGSINVTIHSPSKNYTEDMLPVYQRTVYSSSNGDMLSIKRLAVSVTALSSNENWYVMLEFDDVEDYMITVEVQR